MAILDEVTTCRVCLEELGEEVYVMKCGHAICANELGEEEPFCHSCGGKSELMDEEVRHLKLEQFMTALKRGDDYEKVLKCDSCSEALVKPVLNCCGHVFCEYCYDFNKGNYEKHNCKIYDPELRQFGNQDPALDKIIRSLRTGELTHEELEEYASEHQTNSASASTKKEPLDTETRKSLQKVLLCAVCLEGLSEPYLFECGHAICPNELGEDSSMCVFCGTNRDHLDEDILDRNLKRFIMALRRGRFNERVIECGICHKPMTDAVTTLCGHSFCRTCFVTSIIKVDRCEDCPICHEEADYYSENESLNTIARIADKLRTCNLKPFAREYKRKGLDRGKTRA